MNNTNYELNGMNLSKDIMETLKYYDLECLYSPVGHVFEMWLPLFPFRKWCVQKEKQEIEKFLVLLIYFFTKG